MDRPHLSWTFELFFFPTVKISGIDCLKLGVKWISVKCLGWCRTVSLNAGCSSFPSSSSEPRIPTWAAGRAHTFTPLHSVFCFQHSVASAVSSDLPTQRVGVSWPVGGRGWSEDPDVSRSLSTVTSPQTHFRGPGDVSPGPQGPEVPRALFSCFLTAGCRRLFSWICLFTNHPYAFQLPAFCYSLLFSVL